MDFSMSSRVRENVYEPDDDSYLLVDSLQMDLALISRLKPFLCAEIGCGSGFVICHLAKLFGGSDEPHNNPIILPIATDINRFAIECTREMSGRNGVDLPVLVKTRFLTGFRTNLLFDLIVFNPPYVESEEAEVTESHNDSIVKSYAGGCKGRMVIDEFLAIFPEYLKVDGGLLYLVLYSRNEPESLIREWKGKRQTDSRRSWDICKISERKTGLEHLSVYRFLSQRL